MLCYVGMGVRNGMLDGNLLVTNECEKARLEFLVNKFVTCICMYVRVCMWQAGMQLFKR